MSFSITCYDIKVDIQLDNGVYVFYRTSATGKTRLYHLLQRYIGYGEQVFSMTGYDSIGFKEGNRIIPLDKRLYLFDRYDFYYGMFKDTINELGKNAIVLIDCKSGIDFCESLQFCGIYMEEARITVR